MAKLSVYDNHDTTVIAYDVLDAIAIINKSMAIDFLGEEIGTIDDFSVIAGNELITVKNADGDDRIVTLSANEWIAKEGRCFLCSIHY